VTPRLSAEVTQVSIVSGAQQEDAGNTRQVAPSSLIPGRREKGNLYLLVQVNGEPQGKAELHRELIDILTEGYAGVAGGVTNGLRQAMRAANDFLYQRNLEALPLWQRVGEACCAALRGTDLYIGIAGEAHVYVVHGDEVMVFPPAGIGDSSDTSASQREHPAPLGVAESLGREALFHCAIDADSQIILASGELSKVATPETLARAGRAGAEHLANTLEALGSATDLSALIIEIQTAERTAAPKSRSAPRRRAVIFGKRAPAKTPQRHRPTPTPPVGGIAAGVLAFFLALGARILGFLASGILGSIGRAIRRGSVAVLQGLGTLTQRMLPEPQPATATAETTQTWSQQRVTKVPKKSRLPLIIVLALMAVVAAASATLVMRTRSVNIQFSELLQQAQASYDEAATAGNTQEAVSALGNAEELLEQALQIRPADPEAGELLSDVHLALDQTTRVTRLELIDHVNLGEVMAEPARMLMREDEVYVLDQGGQALYRYALDQNGVFQGSGEEGLLLGPSSQVTEPAIQEVTDLVWVEPGSGRETAALLLLVNGSSLLQVDGPDAATSVSVAGTEMWVEPRFLDTYSGYLYVLDAGEDSILKYAPTGSTYDSLPLEYFHDENPPDLQGARDMAIDGYIFILAGNSVLKYSGGFREEFSISGMEGQGLSDPIAIYTSPETQHLYVADADAGRIVQLTKEGAFVRQFLPPRDEGAFEGLRDLYVDEARGRILALTSDTIFVAPLEQPPAAIE
jgi:hypothetical protein